MVYKISVDELNLDKTLDCGQAFRWNKQLINNQEHWVGVVDNEIWILQQFDDRIETNLSIKKLDKFIHYFDLRLDYKEMFNSLQLDEQGYEVKAYEFSKGIHILRQDLLETMVTFLMSSCNTMYNIRNIVNNICSLYGESIEVEYKGEIIRRYSFPSLEKLKSLSIEELKACSMGFRAEYLKEMLARLNMQHLDSLSCMEYKNALKTLKTFKGIGDKVANCITLFSMHHIQAFPIDTHIKQIINKEFNGYIDISRYGEYAGIIQQYIFYYKAFQ